MNILTATAILTFGIIALTVKTGFAQGRTKKLRSFEVSNIVNASVDSVWKIMVDNFGDVAAYTPNIHHSHCTTDSTIVGVGTERLCTFNQKGNKYLREEIEFMDKDNYHFRVKFNTITQPLNTDLSRVHIYLSPLSPGQTKVRILMDYRTKPAFVGGLAKGKFINIFEDVLLGLKHYTETGERVNAGTGNFGKIKRQYQR
ncbi:SRPBCC family protein [Fulvivirgaceae bacterium BMA12]|uniref:SRPBCC family protein n=1 Tax=Agaribacillus aureus TaxID=3051825 RepID=A0ABT8LCJ0_9BACT|nr:SRPBCC family protein [Fulvivirgaceae bacterium BMA12]